jgi:hypothetical protein
MLKSELKIQLLPLNSNFNFSNKTIESLVVKKKTKPQQETGKKIAKS